MNASDPRIDYTLNVLLGPDRDARRFLVYADAVDAEASIPCLQVVPSGFFTPRVYGTPSSLPSLPLASLDDVPVLFGRSEVTRRGSCLTIGADIVASAYFILTRYEEWVRRDVRDEHGRFPGRESLPFRAGFLDRPIVDEYAALLRKWAGEIGIELPQPDRRFSVLLTHDVDSIGPRPRRFGAARCIASGLLGRSPPGSALRDAAAAVGLVRHSADNLDEVIRLDRRLTDRFSPDRCRSVFFFMAGGLAPFDGDYRIRHKHTRRRLQEVSASGADIGLHASYAAGIDPARLAGERQVLQEVAGRPIEKNRHHFLAWREPQHGITLADAGLRWDATLGYADVAGFRLGVCRPVPLFDPDHQRPLGIEEHPLAVMDCTLDRPHYMNLDEEAAFDCVRRLIDATRRHHGEFVCLWHNTVLASTDTSYHKRLYPRVLDYLGQVLEEVTCVS